MYYAVKDGKVNRHEFTSSFRTVYSSSPKAVKAVLSPDEKNVLILRADGTVIAMNTNTHGSKTSIMRRMLLRQKTLHGMGINLFRFKLTENGRRNQFNPIL